MSDRRNPQELEQMAEEVLAASQLAAAARSRLAQGTAGLTETEFQALDALVKGQHQPLTVGEIQRQIGVLPAQMSRILRSLENRDEGQSLLQCRINPQDRRRVDVTLTPAGKTAYHKYRKGRLSFLVDFLTNLTPNDRVVFMKIIRDFHQRILDRLRDE